MKERSNHKSENGRTLANLRQFCYLTNRYRIDAVQCLDHRSPQFGVSFFAFRAYARPLQTLRSSIPACFRFSRQTAFNAMAPRSG